MYLQRKPRYTAHRALWNSPSWPQSGASFPVPATLLPNCSTRSYPATMRRHRTTLPTCHPEVGWAMTLTP